MPDDDLRRGNYGAWVDVTRRIGGKVQLAARLSADQTNLGDDGTIIWRYPTLPPGTCAGSGSCSDGHAISQTDVQARAAMVFDGRDREYDTRRGALVEAGLFFGSAADGYTGAFAMARGWTTPRQGTRLTTACRLPRTVAHAGRGRVA